MLRIVPVLAILTILAVTPSATAAPEVKVAVVDMLDLINKHPDTAALRKLFEKKEQEAGEFLQRSKERLERLRKEILELGEGDTRRVNKQSQFEKQAWLDEYDFKFKINAARRQYVRELETIHAAVRSNVSQYARNNGISLVLQMTKDELNATDRNDYVMKVALRAVVWFDTPLDITDEVAKMFEKK